MSKRQSAYLNLTIFFILVVATFFGVNNYFEEKDRQNYMDALSLTSKGHYAEALDKVKKSTYQDSIVLTSELYPMLNNPNTVIDGLIVKMSNDELEKTKARINQKQYFTNPDVNKFYLEKISKIENIEEYKKNLLLKAVKKQIKNNQPATQA